MKASIASRPATLTPPTTPGTRSMRRIRGAMSKAILGSTHAGVRW
jgi:hypothetical protein